MEVLANPKITTRRTEFRAIVLTQFFTALTDQTFRTALILMAYTMGTATGNWVAPLGLILFQLPYALFSLLAGAWTDRHSKRSVLIWMKLAEVPLIALGLWGMWLILPEGNGWPWVLLFGTLFGLGTLASFLFPARYALLPEVLDDGELAHGNGNLDLGHYAGILLGTLAAGPLLYALEAPGYGWMAWLLPTAAFAAFVTAFFVPYSPPADPKRLLSEGLNPLTFVRHWEMLKAHHPGLVPTIAALVAFWFGSSLYFLTVLEFGEEVLGLSTLSQQHGLILLLCAGLGAGSWLAGRLSKGVIDLGLTGLGALLWTFASLGLAFSTSLPFSFAWILLAGFAAGLYFVPLNAYLERHSPPDHRGTTIAVSNIVTVFGVLISALLVLGLRFLFGVGPHGIFLVLGCLFIGVTATLFYYLREYVLRLFIVAITRIVYRIEAHGTEHIPREGPVLIVLNHVSFMDGNIVMACFNRFIRFVVYKAHYHHPALHWMATTMKTIPVDSEDDPRNIVRSLRRATELLQQGEAVCIFPEGSLSRLGIMLPFKRGMEQILKRTPEVPIVPGYIHGMWGSIFSFSGGKFFWKWPQRWRYPVTVQFGPPLPSSTPATEVRQRVMELGADCYQHRRKVILPLHRQFVRVARRQPRRFCIADQRRGEMSFGTALLNSVVLTRLLERKLGREKCVGVLLPPSVGGTLTNVALAFLHRTSVNLNYSVGVDVVLRCIEQAGVRQVLTSPEFLERLVEKNPDFDVEKLRSCCEIIYLEDLRQEVRLSDKLFGAAARILPAWMTDYFLLHMGGHSADDIVTLVFSSGSTGEPKGIMLDHVNIFSNIELMVQLVNADENDRMMGVLPFFHSFGYTGTLWLALVHGSGGVFHTSPLEPEVIAELMRKYKPKIFLSTATFLRAFMRRCEREDFASLRLIVCGAEKLPMQLADQFEKRFGIRPQEGYGCTELSPVVSANRGDIQIGTFTQVGSKNGTIGHPIPCTAVKIVDPDSRKPLPLGEEGLILVKGPGVMRGYLHKPEMTADVIRDGWYATGDIGKLDEDGFITITDRMSRFSKIAGEMVPHYKVEDQIHDILGVPERHVVVMGVPDERKGERLVVLHTPMPMTVEAVWEKLKESGLPAIWIPARANFYEVESLPVLGSGKLDLKGCKTMALEQVQQKSPAGATS